mgnify:CR=1 FL=1
MLTNLKLFLLFLTASPWIASSFTTTPLNYFRLSTSTSASRRIQGSARQFSAEDDPLEGLDEARRNNLFQCLLRDLQIEEVPLLECDAVQAHTLQAALWTTMAELSEQDEAQKVCLVLNGIGVDSLRTFVDDFLVIKGQDRLMQHLPELERFSVSLVGKGAGPAIILETKAKPDSVKPAISNISDFEESKIIAAMKAFIDRQIVGLEVCPYTKNINKAPQGIEELGIQPGQIGYRYCGFQEVCHVLSTFWTCICEMLSVPDETLSTTVLAMPAVGTGQESDVQAHNRFSAVAELISHSLCLYRGDDVFETLHFYPDYNRDLVFPPDIPAHGHLPPSAWLRPMLVKNGNAEDAEKLSDEDLALSNYQRRAPYTSVVIKRVSYFEALAGSENQIVDLDLGDGQIEKASGVATYARNARKLAAQGEIALQTALENEIIMGRSFQ